mgnify:CR=1 FL=1
MIIVRQIRGFGSVIPAECFENPDSPGCNVEPLIVPPAALVKKMKLPLGLIAAGVLLGIVVGVGTGIGIARVSA